MKAALTFTFMLMLTSALFAQSNFYRLSAGAGAGLTRPLTEVPQRDFGLGGYGALDYLFTPFLSLGLELQKGEINGGDYTTDPQQRQFVNSYTSFSLNGKISLGQIIGNNYNSLSNNLRGLYIGAGMGLIQNSTEFITRDIINTDSVYVGLNKTKDINFPLNLGINFYFADREGFYRYVLNFNYQGNITLGENLDGYDDSRVTFRGGKTDIYTYLSVGLKYQFGRMGLSRKTFRRY